MIGGLLCSPRKAVKRSARYQTKQLTGLVRGWKETLAVEVLKARVLSADLC